MNKMEIPIQSLLFVGIIPALILLYISLKGYEGYYKEKTVFLTFIVGIITGLIAVVVRLIFNPLPFLIVFIVLFAAFEQLFKTIVLNLRRFQGKKETPIYGLSLGLGFGSSFTTILIAGGFVVYKELYPIFLVSICSISFILFHAATSAYIGFGVYRMKLSKYLFVAFLFQLIFNTLFDGAIAMGLSPLDTYFQLGLIIYGLTIFLYVIRKVLPNIFKEERRKRSRKFS